MVILGDESQFTLTLLLTAAAGLPGSEGKPGWSAHCLESCPWYHSKPDSKYQSKIVKNRVSPVFQT